MSAPSQQPTPTPIETIPSPAPLGYALYRCVPQLGPASPSDTRPALLPLHGGRTGVIYAQCPVSQMVKLEREGWSRIFDADAYTIEGPAGQVDCILLAAGAPLANTPLGSTRQKMVVHKDVFAATGLDPETGFPPVEQPTKPPTAQTTTAKPPAPKSSTLTKE